MALSKLFKSTKFIVHVRIIEDTYLPRWGSKISSNLTIISISKYIQKNLPFKSIQLYDIYKFETFTNSIYEPLKVNDLFQIGIIGRVTFTKGLAPLISIIEEANKNGKNGNFVFNLFGHLSDDPNDLEFITKLKSFKNVIFRGFEGDRNIIYNNIHCVLHCSVQEALGRIFIESIDCLKPFVGFNEGGIGEIGEIVDLSSNLLDAQDLRFAEKAVENLLRIKNNYLEHVDKIRAAKKIARNIFNASNYTDTLDNLLK